MADEKKKAPQFAQVIPVFLVDDVASTTEFYRDLLGFSVDFLYGDPATYASVSRGNVSINFSQSRPAGRRNSVSAAGPGNGVDAYICVTDVDALFRELKSRQAKMESEPASESYGMREFNLTDCNGYRLCFGQALVE